MTCAACPLSVKQAISKVDGVNKINVSFDKREAVATFNDVKASAQKLTPAMEKAADPSSVKR